MKSLQVILLVTAFVFTLPAQQDQLPEPAQRTDAPYRLFRTKNMYTLLKLDTRTGQIWQVQWSTDDDKRFYYPLNTLSLADGKIVSRFTLVPTTNIYTFVLLDQEDGRMWQIQWNTDSEKRLILPIQDEETAARMAKPQ